jgi:hypothetical protein
VKITLCGSYIDIGELDPNSNLSPEAALATYGGFCAELDKLGLVYIQVMRWWVSYDLMIDSKPQGVQ